MPGLSTLRSSTSSAMTCFLPLERSESGEVTRRGGGGKTDWRKLLTFHPTGRFILGLMRIGELANKTGLTTKAIRYYEGIGVIPSAEREPNGYRDYDRSAIARLEFVKDAQAAGLSLGEIEWVLDLKDKGESTCGHVVSLLDSHLADIDRQLGELRRMKARIAQISTRARQMDPDSCTDPIRCQTLANNS